VRHRDDAHGVPLAGHQGREEPVHVVEIRQLEERGPAERLQAASRVGDAVAEEAGAHRVGHTRGQAADGRVAAPLPLARHEPQAGRAGRIAKGREEPRDLGRIVLTVAVERHDRGAARRPDACADRRALTGGSRMTGHAQPRVATAHLGETRRRRVAAAVVDHDDLERIVRAEGGVHLADQRPDRLRLVEHGDDDGHRAGERRAHGRLETPGRRRARAHGRLPCGRAAAVAAGGRRTATDCPR
jgi:hypothetical protein